MAVRRTSGKRSSVEQYAAHLAGAFRREAPRPPGLLVGKRADGGDFVIPDEQRLETNTHIIGPPGFGKSYLQYFLACQDILAGNGVCVIDPHSTLYEMMLNFAIQREIPAERVLIIDPTLGNWTLKMNPLETLAGIGDGTALARASLVRVTGEMDTQRTPRLRRLLFGVCRAMELAELPMALLPWFCSLTAQGAAFRERVMRHPNLRGVKEAPVQLVWEEFAELTKTAKQEQIESSVNRATAFAEDSRVLSMLTYSAGNLDWFEAMNKGMIVLCNLGSVVASGAAAIAPDLRQLIGVLIMHGVAAAAKRRHPRKNPKPFAVYCDEFGRYVSDDFAEALDELRKFRVPLTLSHQHLPQIEEESRKVLGSLMNSCQIKMVFGGLERGSGLERMAKALFTGELDFAETKALVSMKGFRPVQTWVDIVSHTEGGSDNWSSSSSHSTASASSTAVVYDADGILFPSVTGHIETTTSHEAVTSGSQAGGSRNWATTITRQPMTTFEEFDQPAVPIFPGTDELWEKKYGLLNRLPKRYLAVRVYNDPTVVVETIGIHEQWAPDDVLAAYQEAVCDRSPYIAATSDAERMFATLLDDHHLTPLANEPEPSDFRQSPPVTDNLVIDVPAPTDHGHEPQATPNAKRQFHGRAKAKRTARRKKPR